MARLTSRRLRLRRYVCSGQTVSFVADADGSGPLVSPPALVVFQPELDLERVPTAPVAQRVGQRTAPAGVERDLTVGSRDVRRSLVNASRVAGDDSTGTAATDWGRSSSIGVPDRCFAIIAASKARFASLDVRPVPACQVSIHGNSRLHRWKRSYPRSVRRTLVGDGDPRGGHRQHGRRETPRVERCVERRERASHPSHDPMPRNTDGQASHSPHETVEQSSSVPQRGHASPCVGSIS